MKVLATFDGSEFSESTLPTLEWLAGNPTVEFTLMSVSAEPAGTAVATGVPMQRAAAAFSSSGGRVIALDPPPPMMVETKDQAMQRKLAELRDYLAKIASRIPTATDVKLEAHIGHNPAAIIIERAIAEQPDVIVMATHGKTGLIHALFGDVAEQVVRAGVAPVLLVNPDYVQRRRDGNAKA